MIELGFPRARALRGGVAAWRAAGFPLAPLLPPPKNLGVLGVLGG